MKCQLDHLLDECLAELNRGADLEDVLSRYPAHADQLRPALAASAWMREHVPAPRHRLDRKAEFMATVARRRRLVETVDGMVVELKAGVPLDEVMARNDLALRPVARAAHRMHEDRVPMPAEGSHEARKQQIMAMAAQMRTARGLPPASAEDDRSAGGFDLRDLVMGLLPRPSWTRRAASGATAAVLAVLIGVVGMSSMQTAAASSLPGDGLYHVKRLGERAQMLFAFDPAHRMDLRSMFEKRRLHEMKALLEEGRAVPDSVLSQYLEDHVASSDDLAGLTEDQRSLLRRALESSGMAERLPVELAGSGSSAPENSPRDGTGAPSVGAQSWPEPRPMPADHVSPAVDAEEAPVDVQPAVQRRNQDANAARDAAGRQQDAGTAGPLRDENGMVPPVVQQPDDPQRDDEGDPASTEDPVASGREDRGGAAAPPPAEVPEPGTQPAPGGGDAPAPPPIVGPDPSGDDGGQEVAPPIVGPGPAPAPGEDDPEPAPGHGERP